MRVDYRILGSLEALRDGEPLELGGAKQRTVLAMLLVNANRLVTTDALTEALWSKKPPAKPLTSIQGYVSHLRKALAPEHGSEVIVTEPAGYRLAVAPTDTDLGRFEALVRSARAALGEDRPAEASTDLTEALALFRGAPLADFAYEDWARVEVDRIEELRLVCLEDRLDADLALGRHTELVGELEALVAQHSLRERLQGQLMLALYRSGRQADALDVYQATRTALVEQLGLEPGPDIQALHGQILNQDPGLAAPVRQAPPAHTVQLPTPTSTFIGRERELKQLTALVERDDLRLVTLTGPGGTGKTRLALASAATVSDRYPDGVFWVALSTIRDPALVTETISQTLGATNGLADHIGRRKQLLLLDNLEQVIEAATDLSNLLRDCPNLSLLVTSREVLRVQGEVEYPVPPLAEPDAIALFCARSQLEPSAEIAELCARLDSLPLAVELAAARTKALSPAQIVERLSQRLELLKGGRDADPRQQTLRATIEWSYDLLPEEEQRLFAALSVFAGGCTLEAAEEVADADLDTLQSLVEKSLLRFSNERFWMLETIREFAREQLGPTEVEPLERRHREHMVAFAEANGPGLRSASEAAVADAVAHEHPNLREAVAHALAAGEPDDVARIVGTLFPYLILHGHMGEALEWMAGPLADRDLLSNDGLAGLLIGGSEIARFAGDLDLAIELKEQYVSLPDDSQPRRWAAGLLADLAEIALDQGDIARARSYAERSAEAGAGPRAELPFAELALRLGDLSSAESHALAALAGMNEGEFNHACALELLGETARRSGDPAHAREHFADGLREFAQLRDGGGVADCLDGFSRLAAEAGDHDRAGRLSRAARTLRAESGRTPIRSDVPPVEASEALRAESAAMTLDEAVDLALSND